MFEGLRRFWRRHRGKFIFAGVTIGVGYALKTWGCRLLVLSLL